MKYGGPFLNHHFEILRSDSCWLENKKPNGMVGIYKNQKIMMHEINGEELRKILESGSAENSLTHQ